MRKRPITDAILAELHSDPHRSAEEIAKAAGSTAASVRAIACRAQVKFGVKGPRRGLSEENSRWVWELANSSDCTFTSALNAIVTDARCEAEDAANA